MLQTKATEPANQIHRAAFHRPERGPRNSHRASRCAMTATVLLTSILLAGCIGISAQGGNSRPDTPRIGDTYVYEVAIEELDGEALRNWTETLRFQGPSGDWPYAPDAECQIIDIRREFASSDVESRACLDPTTLAWIAVHEPDEGREPAHDRFEYPSLDPVWDGLQLPVVESLRTAEASSYTVQFSRPSVQGDGYLVSWAWTGDTAALEGRTVAPNLTDSRLNWTATYQDGVPLPTEFTYTTENYGTTNLVTSFLPNNLSGHSFRTRYSLLDVTRGVGNPVAQEVPMDEDPIPRPTLQTFDSGSVPRGERAWQRIMDPGRPYTLYPLEKAWDFALANDPDLAAFLDGWDLVFPAWVTYDSFNDTERTSFDYVWRVAVCKPDGSCYRSVSGVRRFADGVERPFIDLEDDTGELRPRGYQSGTFQSFPVPMDTAQNASERALEADEVAPTWAAYQPDLPLRHYEAGLTPEVGGTPVVDRVRRGYTVVFAHGRMWFDRTNPLHFMSFRRVFSHFDGLTGSPLSVMSLTGDPPVDWTHNRPILEEVADGGHGPRLQHILS